MCPRQLSRSGPHLAGRAQATGARPGSALVALLAMRASQRVSVSLLTPPQWAGRPLGLLFAVLISLRWGFGKPAAPMEWAQEAACRQQPSVTSVCSGPVLVFTVQCGRSMGITAVGAHTAQCRAHAAMLSASRPPLATLCATLGARSARCKGAPGQSELSARPPTWPGPF